MKFEAKYHFEDYKGKRIWDLTPIGVSDIRASDGSKQWRFQCVCGKEIVKQPRLVISGRMKSCGCMWHKNRIYNEGEPGNRSRVDPYKYIGVKKNMLTVVGFSIFADGKMRLKCVCDCGKETFALPSQFNNGDKKSCGCLLGHLWGGKKDFTVREYHGFSGGRLYNKYTQIKQRCYNPKNKFYEKYGGRGIKMCKEWFDSPKAFIDWSIENGGLDESLSIDRIDVNGPYSPDNCRYTTFKIQQRNKQNNRVLEHNGESHCVAEWAEIIGVPYNTLSNRLCRGWSVEKTLTTPVDQTHKKHKNI